MTERLLYETHSHTPLCRHAVGEPEEYATAAERRGLRGLTVTCHNPMPNDFSRLVRMRPEQFDEYLALVERARTALADRVDVRLGLECDYFPGYVDWVEQQLQSADFQYVLGSVHPQLHEMRERFGGGDAVEYQRTYFGLLADAAETGLFDSISHPDLVKNIAPNDWQPERVMPDILRALDRIAATGTAMELNTSGANKRIQEMNPFPAMLVEMRERRIPVVIGADAHEPDRVGDRFDEALQLLQACDYTHVSFFLDRQRRDVPIDAARASLSGAEMAAKNTRSHEK